MFSLVSVFKIFETDTNENIIVLIIKAIVFIELVSKLPF